MTTYQADTSAPHGRFAVVVSRFNSAVTTKLLDGAVESLTAHGVDKDAIDVAWVPGAWELPLVVQRLARGKSYAAILCLGAVIHGDTSHDPHINRALSVHLSAIALEADVPVAFGVLTCDTLEQALERAGGRVGNRGAECAEAALEMANLLEVLPRP